MSTGCVYTVLTKWSWHQSDDLCTQGTRGCVQPVVALIYIQHATDCWTSVTDTVVTSMLPLCFLLSSTSLIEYWHVRIQAACRWSLTRMKYRLCHLWVYLNRDACMIHVFISTGTSSHAVVKAISVGYAVNVNWIQCWLNEVGIKVLIYVHKGPEAVYSQ